ncbi:MAG TPA: hypothetical protein VMV09_10010, partial [Candidatus Saccharimonadales bacterium]|nr:hypothetical protein [Candidatus Saccharimonadales bacterium]
MSGGEPSPPDRLPTGTDQLLSSVAIFGSDVMLVLDPARNLLWASPNTVTLLAGPDSRGPVEPPPAAGTPLARILDDPRAADVVGKVLATGESASGELRQNDWRRVLKAVGAPADLPDGSRRVLLILTDITAERRLTRAN